MNNTRESEMDERRQSAALALRSVDVFGVRIFLSCFVQSHTIALSITHGDANPDIAWIE